jgi:hypothetical protein
VWVEHLDEERIELLRRWGQGLANDGRDEVRAAGRAISILIEEIERLHADLSKERSMGRAVTPAEGHASAVAPDLQASLRGRLAQLRRRRRASVPSREPG